MSKEQGNDPMDHPRIEDEHVIERYLAGRLPEEDEARFEEHLFACGACLEQVQAGEEMRRGLHAVAAEEAARTAVATGVLAWLARLSRSQLTGLAAFLLALVLLPSALLWWQGGGTDAGLDRPLSDFQMISLGVERSGRPAEIRPEAGKDALLLSLELPLGASDGRYAVRLQDMEGKILWREKDLEPNLYDTLLVALPSSFLPPGTYRLMVEGPGSAAGQEVILEVTATAK